MRRPDIVDIEGIRLSQTANLMVDPHDASVKDSLLHRSGTETPDGAVAEGAPARAFACTSRGRPAVVAMQ